jgi:hypothetical protein
VQIRSISFALCVMATAASAYAQPGSPKPVKLPETFSANAQVKGAAGAAATSLQVVIDRYTPDADRELVATALKTGGYPAFLTALRKAPVVGHVEIGDKKFDVRWARQQPSSNGRTIVVVTDKPMYFVGAGAADAKPKEGYEVGLLQFEVDDIGLGSGTMAAAARVKPGDPTGVRVDDYATEPIKLVTVRKLLQ